MVLLVVVVVVVVVDVVVVVVVIVVVVVVVAAVVGVVAVVVRPARGIAGQENAEAVRPRPQGEAERQGPQIWNLILQDHPKVIHHVVNGNVQKEKFLHNS